MVIRLCIPPSARFLDFSLNTLVLALFLLLSSGQLIRQCRSMQTYQKKYIKAFGVYFGIVIILSFFSNFFGMVPLKNQLTYLLQFVYTEVLPSIIIILLLKKKSEFVFVCNLILASALFATGYAIFTFITQSNPLFLLFNTTGEEMEITADISRGGMLEGTGVGLLNNKISMSLVALLFFVFFWGKNILNRSLINAVLILSLISVILTSQRSAILCVIIFYFYMVVKEKRNIKQTAFFSITIVSVAIYASYNFSQFHQLKNVFYSILFFWNDEEQARMGVVGSSMELRTNQLITVISYAGHNILTGLGYGFHHYFYRVLGQSQSEIAYRMAGLESIVLGTIASTGLIGLYFLLKTYYRMLILMLKSCAKQKSTYFIGFVGAYIVAIIMTDTSGTDYLFFTFCALNIVYSRLYASPTNLDDVLKLKVS